MKSDLERSLLRLADSNATLASRVRKLEANLRNEGSAESWGKALSMYSLLPGLRGFWPMSSVDESGNAIDLSGQGHLLTATGAAGPVYNCDGLLPYAIFNGTDETLASSDAAFRITGMEARTGATRRGLTFGGWFYLQTFDAVNNDGVMGRWFDPNQMSYILYIDHTTQTVALGVTSSGAGATFKGMAGGTFTTRAWHFAAGRFVPSTSLDVYLDKAKYTNAAAIPASIHAGTADLHLATFDIGGAFMEGAASLCFVCAAALTDATINALYEHTRALFGV